MGPEGPDERDFCGHRSGHWPVFGRPVPVRMGGSRREELAVKRPHLMKVLGTAILISGLWQSVSRSSLSARRQITIVAHGSVA